MIYYPVFIKLQLPANVGTFSIHKESFEYMRLPLSSQVKKAKQIEKSSWITADDELLLFPSYLTTVTLARKDENRSSATFRRLQASHP